MPAFRDLTGQVFGKWTVLKIHQRASRANGKSRWLCVCGGCGRESVVAGTDLTRTDSKRSSGCLECRGHGKSGTITWACWAAMMQRTGSSQQNAKLRACNPRTSQYLSVRVCEGLRDFVSFIEALGERPSKKHSLDRIETLGHYTCGKCEECARNNWTANCRWATAIEQSRNRTSNVMWTHGGETMCIAAWAERLGIHQDTLNARVATHGWTVEKALTTPKLRKRTRKPRRGEPVTWL